MPVYDMKCPNGHMWEEQRPMSECDNPTPCPECGERGWIAFLSTPVVPWYPGTTREFFKEKVRRPD